MSPKYVISTVTYTEDSVNLQDYIIKIYRTLLASIMHDKNKGQLDPCHYNFTKLDFMLKSMPLSGMIFNMKPNFTEL